MRYFTLGLFIISHIYVYLEPRFSAGGKGLDEAAENRNYLSSRMIEEVHEIVRVLQLTTYDEDEWESDNVTLMVLS